MKGFLSYGGASLVSGAFLDMIFQSGIGNPIPWRRDLGMIILGIAGIVLAIRNRKRLNE